MAIKKEVIDRWKHAVIHLECIGTRDSQELDQAVAAASYKLRNGEISPQKFWELTNTMRYRRCNGTSVFVCDQGRRYLFTARHVIADPEASNQMAELFEDHIRSAPPVSQPLVRALLDPVTKSRLHTVIARVPCLSDVSADDKITGDDFLMNLSAGAPALAPYSLSDEDIDLGVIALDDRNKAFADRMIELGYKPISISDVAVDAPSEGEELFTVGFPHSTSLVGRRERASGHGFRSDLISEPTFSFGRVAMAHPRLPYFWADLSAYPGNSGGPIVQGDKLVGIVSSQPVLPLDTASTDNPISGNDHCYRIPFAKGISAKFALALFDVQRQKSNTSRAMMG